MSNDIKYEELRAHYRTYKTRMISACYSSEGGELKEAVEEIPKLEQQLLEFCFSNGYNIQDLQQFFRDVDNDALPAGFLPG